MLTDQEDAPLVITLWSRSIKKTRKPWVCGVCDKHHEPGGPKHDSAFLVDGEFDRLQRCTAPAVCGGYNFEKE